MGAPALCPQWARSFLINCQSRKFLTDTAAGLSGWDRFQLKLPLFLVVLTWQNKPIQVDIGTLTLKDKMIVQIWPHFDDFSQHFTLDLLSWQMISKLELIGSLWSLDHILIDSDLYLKPNLLISLRHVFVIIYSREIFLIKILIFTYLFNFQLFAHTHTRVFETNFKTPSHIISGTEGECFKIKKHIFANFNYWYIQNLSFYK